jgi:hypothetical protein
VLSVNREVPDEPISSGLSWKACRFLTGLDVGLSAAIAALSWLAFHSWLRGEYWWAKLNVAGALFYGPKVYLMGLSRASLAGFALLFVVYTGLGVLFSRMARQEGFFRNLLLGCLLGMSWHIFAQRFFWPLLDLSGPAYYPVLATLPAHLIVGLCLARFSGRFRSLAAAFGDPSWAAVLAEPAQVEEKREVPAGMDPGGEASDGFPQPVQGSGAASPMVAEDPSDEARSAPDGDAEVEVGSSGDDSGSPPDSSSAAEGEPLGKKDERFDC